MNPRQVLVRLVRAGPPPWNRLALSALLGLAAAAATIGLLAGSGYVVDRAAFRPGLGAIAGVLAAVEVLAFLRAPLRYGERLVIHDSAFRALGRWRVWLFDRLEPLSPAGLGTFGSGDLLERAVEDVDSLQDLYVRGAAPVLIGLGASALGVAVVALVLPTAGLVLALSLLVALVAVPATALAARHLGTTERRLSAELSARTVDLLQGAPDLLAFGADQVALAQVDELNAGLLRAARRRALISGAASAMLTLTLGAAVIGVLWAGVDALRSGHLEPVMLGVLPLAVVGTFDALPGVLAAALSLTDVVAAGRRLLALDVPAPVVDPAQPLAPPPGCPEIAFECASLRYAEDRPWALDGLSARFAPGSRTVVTGPSGAGKTSMVNALLRFWPLDHGTVRAAAVPLDQLAQADARHLVALADQHAQLFSGTLRDNITLARPDAGDEEVEAVVRRAQLDGFVGRLPQGLNTRVGEGGALLSGGERRRVALARALLASAPVLVLDEPTAGLDEDTADRLTTDLLTATAADQTLVVLTHDRRGLEALPTLVMESGRVVEAERC